MANLEIEFNVRRKFKRNEVVKLGRLIATRAAKKDVDLLVIKITDAFDADGNTIQFPFLIVDEK